MVSISNYNKSKKLNEDDKNKNNKKNNKNNANNQNIDTTYPTVTLIDSFQEEKAFVDDEPIRKRCFIIPERAFIGVAFSLNLFFGILITSASFMSLALSSKPSEQAQFAINGLLFVFLALSGIIGLTALKNENAILMRRLSISFWILTALMLIFNVTNYIVRIVSKDESIQNCQIDLDQSFSKENQKQLDLDCDRIISYTLIKSAFQLLFIEVISIYISYSIACYSRKLITKLKFQSKLNEKGDTSDVFTYKIRTTNPPTSDNWVPPRL